LLSGLLNPEFSGHRGRWLHLDLGTKVSTQGKHATITHQDMPSEGAQILVSHGFNQLLEEFASDPPPLELVDHGDSELYDTLLFRQPHMTRQPDAALSAVHIDGRTPGHPVAPIQAFQVVELPFGQPVQSQSV